MKSSWSHLPPSRSTAHNTPTRNPTSEIKRWEAASNSPHSHARPRALTQRRGHPTSWDRAPMASITDKWNYVVFLLFLLHDHVTSIPYLSYLFFSFTIKHSCHHSRAMGRRVGRGHHAATGGAPPSAHRIPTTPFLNLARPTPIHPIHVESAKAAPDSHH